LAVAASAGSAHRVLGANERINLGFIGVGGRGNAHLGNALTFKDVAVTAVCEVDQARLNKAALRVGDSCRKHTDLRKLLDQKDIDAVVIATPDHWHCPAAMLAMKAGKDLYVEKPLGQNIHEARIVADAARKQNRVAMIGTQQRSGNHWAGAVKRIKAGELGKVSLINVWNCWSIGQMAGNIGKPDDCDPPAGVDYDLWLGPAPKRKFNPNRFHFNFYFFWDYSSGMVNAWGVHLFDIVLWAMGNSIRSVTTEGGKFVHDDNRDTPDTTQSVFKCDGYTMAYSMRHGNNWPPHGNMDHGIEFFGTEATLQINRAGYEIYQGKDRKTRKPSIAEKGEGNNTKIHLRNWLDCVRSGRQTENDLEIGHVSSIPGHLANISYRVGRKLRWDAEKEAIIGDEEASKHLSRKHRAPWTV